MGQKFQIRSKTSQIPIKTRDILGPIVLVTLHLIFLIAKFSASMCENFFLKPLKRKIILASFLVPTR